LNVTFDTPDGEVTTIAGYLMAKLGRIPERGDTCRVGEYEVSVREVDGPRVLQVLIEPRPASVTPIRHQPSEPT